MFVTVKNPSFPIVIEKKIRTAAKKT